MNEKKYILRNSTGTDIYDLVHLRFSIDSVAKKSSKSFKKKKSV